MILTISLGVLLAISLYINFNLFRKTEKLEEIAVNQQRFIDDFELIITATGEKVKELDPDGIYAEDDELGVFIKDVEYLQERMDNFKSK